MKIRSTAVCILAIFLASCVPHVNVVDVTIGDGGLLSDQSCAPPCFWDITPGITRESQVWDILKNRNVSQACEKWDNTSESGTRGIECRFPGEGSISIGLDPQLDQIRFVGFTTSNIIKLQDVIKKYGTPTWIAVWPEGTPEHVGVDMTIFYDAISARLDLRQQDGTIYDLQPNAMIDSVSYLSPQEYTDYIKLINQNLHTWKGYGKY